MANASLSMVSSLDGLRIELFQGRIDSFGDERLALLRVLFVSLYFCELRLKRRLCVHLFLTVCFIDVSTLKQSRSACLN